MEEKIFKYIEQWRKRGYESAIPDEVPYELEKRNLAPSYKAICVAIMKNDFQLEYLGFQREKCLWYSEIKRIEIDNRNGVKQLRLF